eukprot:6191386-Pleurochrysis_carterae.AAC.1
MGSLTHTPSQSSSAVALLFRSIARPVTLHMARAAELLQPFVLCTPSHHLQSQLRGLEQLSPAWLAMQLRLAPSRAMRTTTRRRTCGGLSSCS